MPELPEVETVVRGLRGFLPGRHIVEVTVLHEKPLGGVPVEHFNRSVTGKRFERISRFGKYLELVFSDGGRLIAHLRMTGKFIRLDDPEEPLPRHARVVWQLDDRSRLVFQDMRLFGTLRCYLAGEAVVERCKVGVDALDPALDGARLLGLIAGRTVALKQFLLQQDKISGLGNIYVCEALFRAGVSPLLPAGELEQEQAERLVYAIRETLLLALEMNGTTISDFRSVDDKSGEFQAMLQVYGREGKPCRSCGYPVERIKQGQRSTFYCPVCQKS